MHLAQHLVENEPEGFNCSIVWWIGIWTTDTKGCQIAVEIRKKDAKEIFLKKMTSWIVFKGSGLKNTNIKKSFATTVWKLWEVSQYMTLQLTSH